jgi:hypothetical protein
LLIHFNGVPLTEIPGRMQALKKFGRPIVCNEDDKTGEQAAKAAELAVANGGVLGIDAGETQSTFPVHFQWRRRRSGRLRQVTRIDLAVGLVTLFGAACLDLPVPR